MCNFPKKCTKMEFHENKPIKKYLIDGACLLNAYYFSKIYIVCHIIRQENTKITILFSNKIMLGSTVFQNPTRFGNFGVNIPEWPVTKICCFGFNGSLRISI